MNDTLLLIEIILGSLLGSIITIFLYSKKSGRDITAILAIIALSLTIMVIVKGLFESSPPQADIKEYKEQTQYTIDSLKQENFRLKVELKNKFMFPPPEKISRMKGSFET